MELDSRIADLAGPAAEQAGLVLDSVKVSPAGKRTKVLVTVDLPETETGSADLDAVAEASRAIGAALDEANVPSTPYLLEVSTPGTDRPLTTRSHFMRARTRLVEVVAGDRRFVGRLTDVDGDTVVFDVDGQQQTVQLAEITRATIQVELKRLD
ncbi:ribosome maturation factor RimP [Demequina sp. B12]|uniref:ribosome maturation factor RimP n=1 Tax=Demequina sp. B12 TaxID=2992757 RepID=UPI00237A6C9D|nr:ribosome maturation factor RimP [Demequina sp. B12]MDE0573393.1 ribosome maturation factor RimP [Demequina sp. B12]